MAWYSFVATPCTETSQRFKVMIYTMVAWRNSSWKYGRFWWKMPLQWRHNERDGVSNHQPHNCLRNGLFRLRSEKTSKLRVTGLCEGNSPMTGEFPAQRVSNAEKVSIWWRHHLHLPAQLVWHVGICLYKLRTRIGYTLNNKNTSLCEYKLNQNSTIFMQWMNLEISSAKWQIFFFRPHLVKWISLSAHCKRVTNICIGNVRHHWCRFWLVAGLTYSMLIVL